MKSSAIKQIETLFDVGTLAGLPDGPLLERFVNGRDGPAFEAIVARHGPMVFNVCRRILAEPADIEDAFQATFLILVRKAGALRDRRRSRPLALRGRSTGREPGPVPVDPPPFARTAGDPRGRRGVGSFRATRSVASCSRSWTRSWPACPRGCGRRSCSATWRAGRTMRRRGTWSAPGHAQEPAGLGPPAPPPPPHPPGCRARDGHAGRGPRGELRQGGRAGEPGGVDGRCRGPVPHGPGGRRRGGLGVGLDPYGRSAHDHVPLEAQDDRRDPPGGWHLRRRPGRARAERKHRPRRAPGTTSRSASSNSGCNR